MVGEFSQVVGISCCNDPALSIPTHGILVVAMERSQTRESFWMNALFLFLSVSKRFV